MASSVTGHQTWMECALLSLSSHNGFPRRWPLHNVTTMPIWGASEKRPTIHLPKSVFIHGVTSNLISKCHGLGNRCVGLHKPLWVCYPDVNNGWVVKQHTPEGLKVAIATTTTQRTKHRIKMRNPYNVNTCSIQIVFQQDRTFQSSLRYFLFVEDGCRFLSLFCPACLEGGRISHFHWNFNWSSSFKSHGGVVLQLSTTGN